MILHRFLKFRSLLLLSLGSSFLCCLILSKLWSFFSPLFCSLFGLLSLLFLIKLLLAMLLSLLDNCSIVLKLLFIHAFLAVTQKLFVYFRMLRFKEAFFFSFIFSHQITFRLLKYPLLFIKSCDFFSLFAFFLDHHLQVILVRNH